MTHRKPKYLNSESGGTRDRWLISYTDIVTILLILFVAAAAQGMKTQITPPLSAPVKIVRHQALLKTEQKLKQEGLDPRMEPRGLVISLPLTILFQSGKDEVNPQALPTIARIAAALHDIGNKVVLVGYADSVPIHNRRFKNNWELSAARSLNLLELLTTEYGTTESRLSIQSYGSNRPRSSNDTEDGRAANRRVEILILDDGA